MAQKATFNKAGGLKLPTLAASAPIEEPYQAVSPEPVEPEPVEIVPEVEAAPAIDAALVRVRVVKDLARDDLREDYQVGDTVAEIRLAPGWTVGGLLDHLRQRYLEAK